MKHFIPLESNPQVFNKLGHDLGLGHGLSFVDVEFLEANAVEALALILVFPTPASYEADRVKRNLGSSPYTDNGDNKDIFWLLQEINNACGLYALLHAVCNGPSRKSIEKASFLDELLQTSFKDRGTLLEGSRFLEDAYTDAAKLGDTSPPEAEAEVDYHYVCFTACEEMLYELDGDRTGPILWNVPVPTTSHLMSESVCKVIRDYIGERHHCNLMALVEEMA